MDGLFLELGPLRLDGNNVQINPFSWHNEANFLFVDEPVGTGLSFTKNRDGYCSTDEMVDSHFYQFLVSFLTMHSRYTSLVDGKVVSRKLFFTGESHAGHYIPSMAAFILEKNKDPSSPLHITLEGFALGNPWIDPKNQYDASDFAHGLGIISQVYFLSTFWPHHILVAPHFGHTTFWSHR